MITNAMRRLSVFLHGLNRTDQPPEVHSPFLLPFLAALGSFFLIFVAGDGMVGSLRRWWAELLIYAAIPILLAFFSLHRSPWHQEMRRASRALVLAAASCTIFGAVIVAATVGMMVLTFVYFGCVDHFSATH